MWPQTRPNGCIPGRSLGAGELTRAAEVIALGLTDMRGTTAPRLHLELMCARVLLPGADVNDRGVHARLDRLERRMGVGVPTHPRRPPAPATSPEPPAARPEPVVAQAASTTSARIEVHTEPVAAPAEPVGEPEQAASAAPAPTAQLSVTDIRRLWPEVLEEVKGKRRFTWMLLSQNAQVAELRNNTLLLAMANAGARDHFGRGGSEDVLREAIVVVLGADFKIETMVDVSANPSSAPTRMPSPSALDESPHRRAVQRSRRPSRSPRRNPWQRSIQPSAKRPA